MAVAGSLTYDTELNTKGFEKGISGLSSKTVALGNILADAFEKAGQVLVDIGKQGIDYNKQIEKYQTALTTLTGSSQKANKIIENVKKDAAKTPFDVSGLVQGNQLLISAGVDADKAREDILNLGNAIAATGGGNEELSRMAVNLQQIKNVGKASALDIKQFAYAGIDIYGLLADSMGVTREEATKLDVSYEDLTKALQYASEEGGKYYGAMENQSKTLGGQIETLKDNFNAFLGEATEPLFNFLRDTALPIINDIITGEGKISDWISEHEQLLTLLGILIGTITTAIIAYNIAINAATIATTIATAATTAFGAVMAFVTSPITIIIAIIGALIAIGYLLIKNWDTIKDTAKKVWNWIVDLFKSVVSSIKSAFSKVADIGKNLVEGIWNGIKNAVTWLKNKIKGWVGDVLSFIKKLFGISSPSKVMRDQVGQWLPKGIAIGITANTDSVDKAIDDMNDGIMTRMKRAVSVETGKMGISGISASVNQILTSNQTISGVLSVASVLDGKKVGQGVAPFVTRTVKTAGGV